MDLLGDIGGIIDFLIQIFGLFVFPISEVSFYLVAFEQFFKSEAGQVVKKLIAKQRVMLMLRANWFINEDIKTMYEQIKQKLDDIFDMVRILDKLRKLTWIHRKELFDEEIVKPGLN